MEQKIITANKYLDEKREDIVRDLFRLCKIPSVSVDATEDAPYGVEVKNCLEEVDKLYSENGLKSVNRKNYLLTEYGNGEKSIGIFSHSDVVPAPGEWLYTEAFNPIVKNDCVIGRGVEDNKSGIIASLYAIKAMEHAGIKLNSKLVLYTGGNEEQGMDDIEKYLAENSQPDVNIIPDNEFPVCRGEKGIMHFDVNLSLGKDIISVVAGTAYNIVPDSAVAKIRKDENILNEIKKNMPENISVECDDVITVSAKGISKHAAYPQGSLNAAHELFKFLSGISSLSKEDLSAVSAGCDITEGYNGAVFGIDSSDEVFGELSCVCGFVKNSDGKITLGFDSRYGKDISGDEIKKRVNKKLSDYGVEADNFDYSDSFHISEDSIHLKKILDAYSEITGDTNAKSYLSSGGTYARKLKNAFSIGTHTKGLEGVLDMPQGHGGAHQKDEAMYIPGYIEAIKIIMQIIIKLDLSLN